MAVAIARRVLLPTSGWLDLHSTDASHIFTATYLYLIYLTSVYCTSKTLAGVPFRKAGFVVNLPRSSPTGDPESMDRWNLVTNRCEEPESMRCGLGDEFEVLGILHSMLQLSQLGTTLGFPSHTQD